VTAEPKKVETAEEKANRKLEDRFNKQVDMFAQVQMPAPEVQEKLKAKRSRRHRLRTVRQSRRMNHLRHVRKRLLKSLALLFRSSPRNKSRSHSNED
jgi:hypothetical protein